MGDIGQNTQNEVKTKIILYNIHKKWMQKPLYNAQTYEYKCIYNSGEV